MMVDRHRQEGVPISGDPPAARMRYLRNQSAHVQPPEDPTDPRAEFALGGGVGAGTRVEGLAHRLVAKAVQMVLPIEYSAKHGDVFLGRGVEPAVATLLMLDAAGA